MRPPKFNASIDWVQLGCYGWNLDEALGGAWYGDYEQGDVRYGEDGFAFVGWDGQTIHLDGPPTFVAARFMALMLCGVLKPAVVLGPTSSAVAATTTYDLRAAP